MNARSVRALRRMAAQRRRRARFDKVRKKVGRTLGVRARWLMSMGMALLLVGAVTQAETWPIKNGSHQMLQGFGDGSVNSVYRFHEGIDILASGKGGEDVVAVRKGTIIAVGAEAGGFINVKVEVAKGKFEIDSYVHIKHAFTAKDVGKTISEGADLGTISTTVFNEGSHHLHFEVVDGSIEADAKAFAAYNNGAAAPEKYYRNPFLRFTKAADKDPLQKKPALADTNNDGKKLLVVKSGATNPPTKKDIFGEQPVSGDVDLIADVRDPMHDTFLGASATKRTGYYIEALFKKGVESHGVRTKDAPYILADFDDNWFADEPNTNGKFTQVYADSANQKAAKTGRLRVNPNPTDFPLTRQFIVTNTKGGDGRVANVDAGQFWNTNAKNDAAVKDTDNAANFAGKADTLKNAQARFKDGDYEIFAVMSDAAGNTVNESAGKVRLNNFEQKAGAAKGGGALPAPGVITPLYNPNTIPFVPDFNPKPSRATIDSFFLLGDTVGIFGEQYYPDLLMPAYIFTHRKAWNDGDPLGGFIATLFVKSDADGVVPLTAAWKADLGGRFNVIIDYDRDGLFSWTLDGLGGFKVQLIPEPGSLVLFTTGAALLWRTTRRRNRARDSPA